MMQKTILSVIVSTLLLSGCGSDSSADVSTAPSLPSSEGHLIGTAATGAPITGQLKLLSADGAITEYAVHEQGSFDFDSVSDLQTPALLQIVGASAGQAHELYSIVLKEQLAERVVNITPLTQLLISHAAGVAAPEVFNAPGNYTNSLTIEKLNKAQDDLKAVLGKLFVAAGISPDFDLLSSQFEANYTKADAILDLLDIKFNDTEATITYRANRDYELTLPYGARWTKSLLPTDVTTEEATESLSYLITADSILESMILEQEKNGYMAYVHPAASWFGESGDGLWEYKERTMGNESDTNMDRYRDLSLVSVDKDNQRFEISFTQRLEDAQFASGSRMHAWFQKDQDDKFKFLGEEESLPIHTSLVLKLDSSDTTNKWSMEIDAFPSQAACDTFTASAGGWDWNDSDFSSKLENINDHVALDYVTITGPGFDKPFKLDKIFKTQGKNEGDLASCHLASSEYKFSPILTGYLFDYDPESEAKNPVPDNSFYKISYFRNGELNPFYEREINAGKGISPMTEMLPFMAVKETLVRDAGNFQYIWSRKSKLVTDVDLWISFEGENAGGNLRVPIKDGAMEVSRTDLNDVKHVFHASYDPYGRIMTRSHFAP